MTWQEVVFWSVATSAPVPFLWRAYVDYRARKIVRELAAWRRARYGGAMRQPASTKIGKLTRP